MSENVHVYRFLRSAGRSAALFRPCVSGPEERARGAAFRGSGNGHYGGNAETCMDVGEAMVELPGKNK